MSSGQQQREKDLLAPGPETEIINGTKNSIIIQLFIAGCSYFVTVY